MEQMSRMPTRRRRLGPTVDPGGTTDTWVVIIIIKS